MFFDPYNPLFNTIVIYVVVLGILLILKPNFIYDKKYKYFKGFGTGEGKSLLSLPIIAIILAFVIYIIFSSIEKFYMLQDKYIKTINMSINNNQIINSNNSNK